MKLVKTVANKLSDREFEDLTSKIIATLYDLESGIKGIYDIHINIVSEEWQVDFIPLDSNIPVLKVNAYTTYADDDQEVLRVVPTELTKFSTTVGFKDYSTALSYVAKISIISDFVLALYDYEYVL